MIFLRIFFSATSVVAHSPDGPSIQIFDPTVSEAQSVPALWIKYLESELKLQSVIRVIGRELELHGGVGDYETALSVLALIVETREEGKPTVEHANDVLAKTRDATLHQSVIFPHPIADGYSADFEVIRFGSFEPENLAELANRGMVQYPVDLDTLAGRFCIEQTGLRVTITDFAHKNFHDLLIQNWSLTGKLTTAPLLIFPADPHEYGEDAQFLAEADESHRVQLRGPEVTHRVSVGRDQLVAAPG